MTLRTTVELASPEVRTPSAKIRRSRPWLSLVGVYTISVLFGIGVWELGARIFFSPVLFPPASAVLPELVDQLGQPLLWDAIKASLERILIGFALGSAAGLLVGLLIGQFRVVRLLATPWVVFLRFIPAIALLSPAIVLVGIGNTSKILLIVYATTFIVLLNTVAGVEDIHPQKLRCAQCSGANAWQLFWTVTLPGSLGYILTGMRLAMGISFGTIVAAEMVAANSGLGFLINQSRIFVDTTTIFIAIIVLALLGILADAVIIAVQRTICRRFYV